MTQTGSSLGANRPLAVRCSRPSSGRIAWRSGRVRVGWCSTRNGKAFDHDLFGRNVWQPARDSLFPVRKGMKPDDPRQPKLSRLRRHDLRHAACSWWLREGVDAVVCQRWSGHKTLSVFLDVYQGVAPGREDEGVGRLVKSLDGLPALS